jgi:hypothetical protein
MLPRRSSTDERFGKFARLMLEAGIFCQAARRQGSHEKRPGITRPFLKFSLRAGLTPRLSSYCSTISTRRFCGSRTPSGVGTSRPPLPTPTTAMAVAGTPFCTSASLTALARRSDSAML